jgi:hypothetical protein
MIENGGLAGFPSSTRVFYMKNAGANTPIRRAFLAVAPRERLC